MSKMYPHCSQDEPRLIFPLRMAFHSTLVALLANLRRSEFLLRHVRLISFLRCRFLIAHEPCCFLEHSMQ